MGIIITAIVYITSVTLLILTRTGIIQKGKILFKVTSSSLFIALWVVSVSGNCPESFDFMILVTLVLYMTGDILLAVKKSKKGFIMGMTSFMTGNIILITALTISFGIGWVDLPVLAVFLMTAAAGLGFRRLQYNGIGIIVAVYIFVICIMVTKAVSVNWAGAGAFGLASVAFAAGALLYGVSDIVLANNKFKYKDSRWLSPVNLVLYYIGIGLMALFSTML